MAPPRSRFLLKGDRREFTLRASRLEEKAMDTTWVERLERRDLLSGGHRVKDFAPASLAGDVVKCKVKHGAGLFAARGKYSLILTPAGTYQLLGGPGVLDSFGTWTYTKTGNLTGSAVFDDSNLGLVTTETLAFKSAHAGTFLVTAADGSFQSGTFTL
jgi:hypothetical protein